MFDPHAVSRQRCGYVALGESVGKFPSLQPSSGGEVVNIPEDTADIRGGEIVIHAASPSSRHQICP